LLIGESGTGKELFARSIHNHSRSDGPFIALNCAAIPQSLIESELFGYESGSFTGAKTKGQVGKIELAEKGTLFNVYDPAAMAEARIQLKNLEDRVIFCNDEYDAVNGADAVVIVTEWNQFRNLDLDKVRKGLNKPYFFDLRNIYRKNDMVKLGFNYYGVGQ
jgi:sigma54-dependent transcription regulator